MNKPNLLLLQTAVLLMLCTNIAGASPDLKWVAKGSIKTSFREAGARPFGVETNGTVTYACRIFVGGMYLAGRTWDWSYNGGPHCYVGSAGVDGGCLPS